ncbi:hypothetical protein [Streptomyces sp. NPDC000618]|uniref:hypothetical protein n=1 Tax=Streptomyces sp. NPDC000618 TaxID=3154265 RepID=UPI00331F4012
MLLPEMGLPRHKAFEAMGLAEVLVRTEKAGAGVQISEDGRGLIAAEAVAQQAADASGADCPTALMRWSLMAAYTAWPQPVEMPSAPMRSGVDVIPGAQVPDGALDGLGSLEGVLREMRFAFTRALAGGVEGESVEAVLGQSTGVESGGPLHHLVPQVDDHDRRQRVPGAGVGRVQVTGRREAIADEGDVRPHCLCSPPPPAAGTYGISVPFEKDSGPGWLHLLFG